MNNIKVTCLRNHYVKNGEASPKTRVATLKEILNAQMISKKMGSLCKEDKVCIQNQCSGTRLGKNSTIGGEKVDYFKYWNGVIFVDIDNKLGWTEEENSAIMEKIHKELCEYAWYIWTAPSPSLRGIHIVGYIHSQFHSKKEYIVSASIVYSRVLEILSQLLNISEEEILDKGILDCHNLKNYAQLLKITYGYTYVNDKFRCLTNSHHSFNSIEDYKGFVDDTNAINPLINARLDSSFEKTKGSTAVTKSQQAVCSTPAKLDFKYLSRVQLIYTLMYYFPRKTTEELCRKLYIQTLGKDSKYNERMTEMKSLIKSYQNQSPNPQMEKILREEFGLWLYPKTSQEDDNVLKIQIKNGQYLSDVMDKILNNLADVTLVVSPPASGKTTAISNLDFPLLMTEPYTTIIKNKIERDESLSDFGCLYSNKRIGNKQFLGCKKFCTTPDNLSMIQIDELLKRNIRFIFVDESHTIVSDSEFRPKVMTLFVEKLQECIMCGIKVILMTGTPLSEIGILMDELGGYTTRRIEIQRENTYLKTLTVKRFHTKEDKMSSFYSDAAKFLQKGYKVLIPTNRGNNSVEGIKGCIQQRMPKESIFSEALPSTYYTRRNSEQEYNQEITNNASIEKVNVVFAGTSLSVGVDINHKKKTVILFPELIPSCDIEQYASRLRKADKECYLYVSVDDVPNIDTFRTSFDLFKFDLRYKSGEVIAKHLNCSYAIGMCSLLDGVSADSFEENYVRYDNTSYKYVADRMGCLLQKESYKQKMFESQLPIIKSSCFTKYGFVVFDHSVVNNVSEDIKRIDKDTRNKKKADEKIATYNAAVAIMKDDSAFTSAARLKQLASNEKESHYKHIYDDMIKLLDKGLSVGCLQSIIKDSINSETRRYNYQRRLSKIMEFAKLYKAELCGWIPVNTLHKYLQQIDDYCRLKSNYRDDVFNEFKKQLIEENKKDEDIIRIIFKAAVNKKKVKSKVNTDEKSKTRTYQYSVSKFITDLGLVSMNIDTNILPL